jgi:hypothetical protein
MAGRPRLNCEVKTYRMLFWLRVGEDDDLIAFIESIPVGKRVSAIKTALRLGGIGQLQVESLAEDDELTEAAGNFL